MPSIQSTDFKGIECLYIKKRDPAFFSPMGKQSAGSFKEMQVIEQWYAHNFRQNGAAIYIYVYQKRKKSARKRRLTSEKN